MLIIPAIDLIDGQAVRLTQGDYNRKKVYHQDPVEVAKTFAGSGLTHVHVVDLDGAKGGGIVNHKVLERIATETNLHIDWGGGIKSDDDIRIAFESGAQQVTGGTIAVKQPEVFLRWLKEYGPERLILGADVRGEHIAVSGWQESSDRRLDEFLADYVAKGLRYTICTDVAKDGLLQISSQDVYQRIRHNLPELKLIASGGVSGMADLEALQNIGCYAAIVGKAIYENRVSLEELAEYQIQAF